MNYTEAKQKVENFFFEHPIHSFNLGQMAEYLEMDKITLNEIISDLMKDGVVDKVIQFKASRDFITCRIKKKPFNTCEYKSNDYEKTLDCGCTIFGDEAGWHHTGFCEEHQKMIDEENKKFEDGSNE